MSHAILRNVLLVCAISIGLPTASSATTLRKCGPQPPGTQPVIVLDGIISRIKPDSVDKRDLYSLEVACLNPRDSTRTTGSGIAAIWIVTRQGLTRDAKNTLTALLELQDAHFRRESRYLESLDGLTLPPRHAAIQVVLARSPKGWTAMAIVDRFPVNCFVYDGEQKPPRSGLRPRQVACLGDR